METMLIRVKNIRNISEAKLEIPFENVKLGTAEDVSIDGLCCDISNNIDTSDFCLGLKKLLA